MAKADWHNSVPFSLLAASDVGARGRIDGQSGLAQICEKFPKGTAVTELYQNPIY